MILEENDVVLCTVKRIEGTSVFLEVEGSGEGAMTFSEVSPGRIRNIREFVVPGKRIVCKVLRTKPNLELSLRRVTAKERDEITRRYKKERILQSIIKPILKDTTDSVINQIKSEFDAAEFLDSAKENPELIKKFVPKDSYELLKKIFAEKKEKEKIAKKIIIVKSDAESGIQDIKNILTSVEAEIHYLGSSKFSIQTTAKDYKSANQQLEKALNSIQEKAKAKKLQLEIKGYM